MKEIYCVGNSYGLQLCCQKTKALYVYNQINDIWQFMIHIVFLFFNQSVSLICNILVPSKPFRFSMKQWHQFIDTQAVSTRLLQIKKKSENSPFNFVLFICPFTGVIFDQVSALKTSITDLFKKHTVCFSIWEMSFYILCKLLDLESLK